MYDLEIKPEADKIFKKVSKKSPEQLTHINKKIMEIRSNPNHIYKFLRGPLKGLNRTHIDNSFVLIFKIEHERKMVIIYYFGHHDSIYKSPKYA
jgi:YafQ family addiction module toxin component